MKCDERVLPLLLLVKHWAKCRNIGDASMGFLNSFGLTMQNLSFSSASKLISFLVSFTLFVIQFLQLQNPPVLPCLQRSQNPEESQNRAPHCIRGQSGEPTNFIFAIMIVNAVFAFAGEWEEFQSSPPSEKFFIGNETVSSSNKDDTSQLLV